MAALKIASCLAGELLLEDSLHDHVRLGGGESARASYVRRVGHAQVEHHLVVVKSLHIFQVIRKERRGKKYRVSLKKGTLVIFCLISILEVGFYFLTCVSESEF